MLREDFTKVQRVADAKSLLIETVRFNRALGFETVSATVVVDHFCSETDFISIDSVPVSYRPLLEDRDEAKRDPVSQHCRPSGVPIVWGREVYAFLPSGTQNRRISRRVNSKPFVGRWRARWPGMSVASRYQRANGRAALEPCNTQTRLHEQASCGVEGLVDGIDLLICRTSERIC